MIENLFVWQELIGSMIGAFLPFLLYFIYKFFDFRNKREEQLKFIESELVFTISNVADIYQSIEMFSKTNIESLKKIVKDTPDGVWCGSKAYLPMFYVHTIDSEIVFKNIVSDYLKSILLRCKSYSLDCIELIKDIRHQFEGSVDYNSQVAIAKLNDANSHNLMYIQQLSAYQNMIQNTVLDKNLKTYLKYLIKAHTVLEELNKSGIFFWRLKFSPTFKYFKTHQEYQHYRNSILERLEDHLSDKVEKKYNDAVNLITSNEKSA